MRFATGTLTGQGIALVIFTTPNSDQLCTAALAIVNLILVLIPSKAAYFETTFVALGENVLQQRGFIKHAMPYTESNKLVMTYIHYFTSRCFGGARRQRSDPLEHPFELVRFTIHAEDTMQH